MQIINIGKNNSTFQQILALKENRTKRSKLGLFFVEGVQNYNFKNPGLILVGNETDGLNKFYNEQADDFVKISMRDGIDSLNVACATTAVLYEINRQRK